MGQKTILQRLLFGLPQPPAAYLCDGSDEFPLAGRILIRVTADPLAMWASEHLATLSSGVTIVVHFTGNSSHAGFDVLLITTDHTGRVSAVQPVEVKHHDGYWGRKDVEKLSHADAVSRTDKTLEQLRDVNTFKGATSLPLAFCTWGEEVAIAATGKARACGYLVCRVDTQFSPTLTAQVKLDDGVDATFSTAEATGGAGCAPEHFTTGTGGGVGYIDAEASSALGVRQLKTPVVGSCAEERDDSESADAFPPAKRLRPQV